MVAFIGRTVITNAQSTIEFIRLMCETLLEALRPPIRFKETIQQIYFVGNQSLPVIVFCVCFAAMVTILESSFHMKLIIQNDSMVPGFAAMLILKELGAVVSALLLTSRVGAGIAAEVGTMKITEQIDALRMLGIRPINYIVVPRLVASVVGMTLLTVIANVTCLFVAYLVSDFYLGFTSGVFITAMTRFVHFQDLIFAMIKGACFGFVIPLVSCHFGFQCTSGAEGVGHATTKSVVASSVIIIVLDFVLSFVFSFFS